MSTPTLPYKLPLRVDQGRQFPWFIIDADDNCIAVGSRDVAHALKDAANEMQPLRDAAENALKRLEIEWKRRKQKECDVVTFTVFEQWPEITALRAVLKN